MQGAPSAGGRRRTGTSYRGHKRHIRHTRQPAPLVVPLVTGLPLPKRLNYNAVLLSSRILPARSPPAGEHCHTSSGSSWCLPTVGGPVALTRVPRHGQSRRHRRRSGRRHPDGAILAVGGFGLCGIPSVLIDALLDAGRRPTSRSSPTTAASTTGASACCSPPTASARMTSLLRRREQGVRAAVPRRRARGRADPAGHARRAAARRRLRASRRSSPRPASAPRSPRAACRGATTPTASSRSPRPPKETPRASTASARVRARARRSSPTSRSCTPAKGDRHGNLVFNKSSRNFNPLARDGRARSPSPRSRSSSSPARSTRTRSTCPASTCSASLRVGPTQADREAHRAPHRTTAATRAGVER